MCYVELQSSYQQQFPVLVMSSCSNKIFDQFGKNLILLSKIIDDKTRAVCIWNCVF